MIEGVAAVEVVDPRLGTVTRAAPLQVPRYHHAAIEVAPGKVLVVGGASRDARPLDAIEMIAV